MKTWEDVRCFDDILMPEEKELIGKLEQRAKDRCPFLNKVEEYWFICEKKREWLALAGWDERPIPSPSSCIYHAHVSSLELQLHCFSDYKSCCIYKGIFYSLESLRLI